eukprot:gene4847-5481_t
MSSEKAPLYEENSAQQPGYSTIPAQQGYNEPPPQPQQGYNQPAATTTTQVIQVQPTAALPRVAFNTFPVNVICPRCQTNVVTSVTLENGLMVWLSVGGICLFGGWLGCCLIPFFVNAFKDVVHTCPNCHNIIGTFKRA